MGQGSFCQIFKHQGGWATPGDQCSDHRKGRIDTVPGKTSAAAHSQCLHSKTCCVEKRSHSANVQLVCKIKLIS
jgi:hypothetical protein